MLRQRLALTLLLLATLSLAACRKEPTRGELVGRLVETGESFRIKIDLPNKSDHFKLNYPIQLERTSCVLTGQIDPVDWPRVADCEGNGRGKLVCNNGRKLSFRWTLTSCMGGFGYTQNSPKSRVIFGFGHNKDRALDQLERAKSAT